MATTYMLCPLLPLRLLKLVVNGSLPKLDTPLRYQCQTRQVDGRKQTVSDFFSAGCNQQTPLVRSVIPGEG